MMKKRTFAAYFTVEAALIMPMVLLFMTTMLFVAFFVYDRCILEHCAYEAAVRGSSSLYRTNEAACEAAKQAAITLTDSKIFAASNLSYTVTVTGTDIKVEYECMVNVPLLSWLGQYCNNLDFHIYAVGYAPRDRQVKLIRVMDRIV